MKGALVLCGLGWLLLLLTGSAPASRTEAPGLTLAPTLAVRSFPEALPNDGTSEAEITVTATAEGKPVTGVAVTGRIAGGDGMLQSSSVTTDDRGEAVFHYRAGIAPRTCMLEFNTAVSAQPTVLELPLAAVSYIDLLLVPPAEYDLHKKRQAAAAPIYVLKLDAFPLQLAADGGSSAQVTAQLTFTDGRPAPGVPLKAEAGGDGRIVPSQPATDGGGRMSFRYTVGRTPGTAVIRIIEPSTGLTQTVSILIVEAGPARLELQVDDLMAIGTDHDGTLLPADGYTELPLRIRVTDLMGAPLAGVAVRLEVIDLGCGWVELEDPVTNGLGELRGTYRCGSQTGKVRLRAYAAAGLN
jgi:hypothetical protein